jgi:hypothetical protein
MMTRPAALYADKIVGEQKANSQEYGVSRWQKSSQRRKSESVRQGGLIRTGSGSCIVFLADHLQLGIRNRFFFGRAYYTWEGGLVEGKGVTPSVPIELSPDQLRNGQEAQLELAKSI